MTSLDRGKLANIAVFLERVEGIKGGKEAVAWVQTYEAVMQEIASLDTRRVAVEGDL